MSVLDSISSIAFNALKDVFADFVLLRKESVSVEDKPWQISAEDSQEYSCKAMKTSYRNFEVDGTRIQVNDCKIIILAQSLSVSPKTSDNIRDNSGRVWKIIAVKQDPADATYTCQCR